MVMVVTRDMGEFVRLFDTDVEKIIRRLSPKIKEIEDVKQSLYVTFLHNNTLASWDSSKSSKFSTYIYVCIRYFICSLHKLNHHDFNVKHSLSLDAPITEEGDTSLYQILENPYNRDLATAIDTRTYRNLLEDYTICYDIKGRGLSTVELFDEYILGNNDTAIAEKHSLTNASVGASKMRLRDVIKSIDDGTFHDKLDERDKAFVRASIPRLAKIERRRKLIKRILELKGIKR